jgi:hypothetical protein
VPHERCLKGPLAPAASSYLLFTRRGASAATGERGAYDGRAKIINAEGIDFKKGSLARVDTTELKRGTDVAGSAEGAPAGPAAVPSPAGVSDRRQGPVTCRA